jgi:hypothetical protein
MNIANEWHSSSGGAFHRVNGHTGRGASVAPLTNDGSSWAWAVWDDEHEEHPAHSGYADSFDEAKREADQALSRAD